MPDTPESAHHSYDEVELTAYERFSFLRMYADEVLELLRQTELSPEACKAINEEIQITMLKLAIIDYEHPELT